MSKEYIFVKFTPEYEEVFKQTYTSATPRQYEYYYMPNIFVFMGEIKDSGKGVFLNSFNGRTFVDDISNYESKNR